MSDLYPLKLPASFREKIWGKRELAPLLQRQEPAPIGELWFSFEENQIANGPLQGRTLASLMTEFGPRLMGRSFRPVAMSRRSAGKARGTQPAPPRDARPYFPILAKFIFSSDQLSVQVHPADDYALEHEGGPGKTEAWYVVDAEQGARLAIGLTEKFPTDELRRAAQTGEIKNYLNWIEARKGQIFFVPPGTPHTIGPGLIICEIQQNSDLTYRFHDFDRLGDGGKPRDLHIEQAVAVTRQEPYPGPQEPFPFPLLSSQHNEWRRELLVACPHFAVERIEFEKAVSYSPDPERAHLLMFIAGKGRLRTDAQSAERSAGGGAAAEETLYSAADAYLIPADAGPFALVPDSTTTIIRSYLPDVADLRKQLGEAGASADQIRRLVASAVGGVAVSSV